MNHIPRIDANPAGRDFVAGDVHGEFATLKGLLDQVGFDAGRDRLFALGDLIDRGPDPAAALDWIESGRITLSVRGNHEQRLLERITRAEEEPDAGAWGLAMHPWFADVDRDAWPRWKTVIRAMPLAATVATRNGPVGLVHASPTARTWDAMLGMLRAGDPDTVWHALENTAIARADRLRAAQDGMPDDGQIDGVRAVITGHTPLFRVACTGNTWHIDTNAGLPGGSLTLAQIDVEPIETVTLATNPGAQERAEADLPQASDGLENLADWT